MKKKRKGMFSKSEKYKPTPHASIRKEATSSRLLNVLSLIPSR